MIDNRISTASTVAALLWGLVGILVLAAWVVAIVGTWEYAVLLGLTACATSAVAATAQIHTYVIRMCALVRYSTRELGG